eukprot:CAMPEP_0168348770 /NCGR_PEP_ID=MMETSP0213-20121227/19973_1 /TAXON_ID=151035 /ORGANISM="Euplotes harpa, Strain FSP1.4" /LENGTH=129 /DNA_ID=CAMNT_0008358493 /DNA_START=11 /DNA_END=397 /DNA_ORIENTATION=-
MYKNQLQKKYLEEGLLEIERRRKIQAFLNRSYEREILNVGRAQKMIYLMMKGTSYSIELKMMFSTMYKNQLQKKYLEEGLLEIERRRKIQAFEKEEKEVQEERLINKEPSLLNTLMKMGWREKQDSEVD